MFIPVVLNVYCRRLLPLWVPTLQDERRAIGRDTPSLLPPRPSGSWLLGSRLGHVLAKVEARASTLGSVCFCPCRAASLIVLDKADGKSGYGKKNTTPGSAKMARNRCFKSAARIRAPSPIHSLSSQGVGQPHANGCRQRAQGPAAPPVLRSAPPRSASLPILGWGCIDRVAPWLGKSSLDHRSVVQPVGVGRYAVDGELLYLLRNRRPRLSGLGPGCISTAADAEQPADCGEEAQASVMCC